MITFSNILDSGNTCKLFVLLFSKATVVMFMLNNRSFIEYSFTEWKAEYIVCLTIHINSNKIITSVVNR